MWKPDKPIVIVGSALTDQEAWWHEFKDEFHRLCRGRVDGEWLSGLAAALCPFNIDRAPRKAAEIEFVTVGYQMPGTEFDDPFAPPPAKRPPHLH